MDWPKLIQTKAFVETKEFLVHKFFDRVSMAIKPQHPDWDISFLYTKPSEATGGPSKAALGLTPPTLSQTLGRAPPTEKIGAIQELDVEEVRKAAKAAASAKQVKVALGKAPAVKAGKEGLPSDKSAGAAARARSVVEGLTSKWSLRGC